MPRHAGAEAFRRSFSIDRHIRPAALAFGSSGRAQCASCGIGHAPDAEVSNRLFTRCRSGGSVPGPFLFPERPLGLSDSCFERRVPLQVTVRDNNIDQALRVLKKKLQREGLFREMKRRRAYEKPSDKRARKAGEAVRRARKLARKQAQREGLVAKGRGR